MLLYISRSVCLILLCCFALSACQTSETLTPKSLLSQQEEAVFIAKSGRPMAWDGEFLWGLLAGRGPSEPYSEFFPFDLQGVEHSTLRVDKQLPPYKSFIWHQQHFWVLDYANRVYQIDRQGKLQNEFSLELAGTDKAEQLLSHGDELWVLEKNFYTAPGQERPPHFYKIAPENGAVLDDFSANYPGFESLFENLASDGQYFYVAKSHFYAQDLNRIYRINPRTQEFTVKALGRIYTGLLGLFFEQEKMYMIEMADIRRCGQGCRGILHTLDYDNIQVNARPSVPPIIRPAAGPGRPPGAKNRPQGPPGANRPPGPPPGGPPSGRRPPGGPPSGVGPSVPVQAPTPALSETELSQPERLSLGDFVMPVLSAFRIQSELNLPDFVAAEKARFIAELEQAETNAYYRIPSFSILMASADASQLSAGSEGNFLDPSNASQLSAGSEGNFLDPSDASKLSAGSEGNFFGHVENQSKLPADELSLAKLVVVTNASQPQVYKGRFVNGRFYFQGLVDIDAENTSYLIALNQSLEAEVFVGTLKLNPGIQAALQAAENIDPSQPDAAQRQRFAEAVVQQAASQAAYLEMVQGSELLSYDRLPLVMRSKILFELIAQVPEVAVEVYELFGLPDVLLDDRIRALRERYFEKYPEYFENADPMDPFITQPGRNQSVAGAQAPRS